MAWIKVESSVSRNRKFVQAGPAPSWLWLCGLAYCQEGLTDGFIPREALNYLGVKNAKQLAAHLVTAGLWDVEEGGWQVHDYLQHNKPAGEVRRIQDERRAAGVNGGRRSGEARREANVKQVASTDVKQTANPSTATATATASAPLVHRHTGGAPIHQSHKNHASCGRVCVPADLHSRFVRARNHTGANDELRAWYSQVDREWSEGARATDNPGGDDYRFWRARFDEKWPVDAKAERSGPTVLDAAATRKRYLA